MILSTSNHIQQLINDSGLFSHLKKTIKPNVGLEFSNETILITGAAGSIGSELTKQIIASKFKKLVLVDFAESPLYELQKELEHLGASKVHFILLNITDKVSLEHLFDTIKPSIVFHTAAYKHVPLMEENPYEAVKLNIFGTKSLADLSVLHNAKKFIFISTDKAVNPISVMGMTKNIAEKYLHELNKKNKTLFLITRFGNIFGSNGSVVPLFMKQIELNRSLTLTDKGIICKHKACNLILKIALFKKNDGETFTFNMGQPIKIIDLATILISSYNNEKSNIKIKITGLRLGEKLHEDIVSKNEILEPTSVNDILLVKSKLHSKIKNINFSELKKITPYFKHIELKAILKSYTYIYAFFLRFFSFFNKANSLLVCPATDVFSSARLIR